MKMLDLFSGIGGFSLAAHWTGQIQTAAFCEIEDFPRRVLAARFPGVKIFDDVRKLGGADLADIGPIDIVCGGFPCQPFSLSGSRCGTADERHLWPEMSRIIAECRPNWVVGENVSQFVNVALDDTLTDLENQGYEATAIIIPAAGAGSPQTRERVWILAHLQHADRAGRRAGTSPKIAIDPRQFAGPGIQNGLPDAIGEPTRKTCPCVGPVRDGLYARDNDSCHDRECAPGFDRAIPKPGICGTADGISGWVDGRFWDGDWLRSTELTTYKRDDHAKRLKALGNAIVPQVAYQIFRHIVDIEGAAK